jgi:hypothetical protein
MPVPARVSGSDTNRTSLSASCVRRRDSFSLSGGVLMAIAELMPPFRQVCIRRDSERWAGNVR